MKELIFPVGVVAMLASMLVPLPPTVIDFLLVGNLILALVLLISAFYISDSLKLSSLPTLLLLATLYRLSLNVSTTRLILGRGEAGKAIEAFGTIVIQGNLIVGAVIFLIITLIQFIVIAKGSERVAEVSARFTLDALPGKQMAIDADMRAGLIDFETARQKRQDLQTESRFYGALDGAMKFVKGDAIAGLVVIAINILGGFAIGIFVEGLEVSSAVSKYTILTVGDGLLTQIPALLNSLAAGMVVTRVARGDGRSLASELLGQLGQERPVKFIIAGLTFVLALVPGMPTLAFLVLGFMLLISGVFPRKAAVDDASLQGDRFEPRTPPILQVEVGEQSGRKIFGSRNLLEILRSFQRNVYETHGLILAPPEFSIASQVGMAFRVSMRGVTVVTQALSEEESEKAIVERIFAVLVDLIEKRTPEFVDDILTRRTLDFFDKQSPELVSTVVPGVVTLTQLTSLLKRILREGIPIRHFDVILQAIAEAGPKANGERGILEEVRVALKRVISQKYSDGGGVIRGYTIDPMMDMAFVKAEKGGESVEMEFVSVITDFLKPRLKGGQVVLVSKSARSLVSECLRSIGSLVPVLAYDEISDDVRFESLSHIEFQDAGMEEAVLERLAA